MRESLSVVVFAVDRSRYGIPLSAVGRAVAIVEIEPVPGAPGVVMGAINVAGHPVPVVDLRRRLGLAPRDYALSAHLLIVQTPRRTLAIPADEVIGVSEIETGAIEPAERILPGLARVAGITALPDGLLFLYDIEAFLTSDEEGALDRALEAART